MAKNMKNVFEKKVGEIFGAKLCSAGRQGKSDYTEAKGIKSVSFMISGGCSFDQLEKLSVLLGTKKIDYQPDSYNEYFGEWEATISARDVNFSQVDDVPWDTETVAYNQVRRGSK